MNVKKIRFELDFCLTRGFLRSEFFEAPVILAGFRQSNDGSLFVVSRLSNTFVTPDKQPGFAKEKLQMIEKGEKIDIISEKEVMIDGLSGIEIVGYTSGEQTKLIYQTMLFDGRNSHVMVGIAKSDIPENLDLFHGTAETFKTAR